MNDEPETRTVQCEQEECANNDVAFDVPATSAAMCGVCGSWIVPPDEVAPEPNGGIFTPPLPGSEPIPDLT